MPSIARRMKTVSVLSYPSTVDSYGQSRRGTATSRTVSMAIILGNQYAQNRPNELTAEAIGITPDSSITPENEIQDGLVYYLVKKVIPSGRFYQVILEVKK